MTRCWAVLGGAALDDSAFKVALSGNGYTSKDPIFSNWLYPLRELTLHEGYAHFAIRVDEGGAAALPPDGAARPAACRPDASRDHGSTGHAGGQQLYLPFPQPLLAEVARAVDAHAVVEELQDTWSRRARSHLRRAEACSRRPSSSRPTSASARGCRSRPRRRPRHRPAPAAPRRQRRAGALGGRRPMGSRHLAAGALPRGVLAARRARALRTRRHRRPGVPRSRPTGWCRIAGWCRPRTGLGAGPPGRLPGPGHRVRRAGGRVHGGRGLRRPLRRGGEGARGPGAGDPMLEPSPGAASAGLPSQAREGVRHGAPVGPRRQRLLSARAWAFPGSSRRAKSRAVRASAHFPWRARISPRSR